MIKKTFVSMLLIQLLLNVSFVSGQQAYQNGWDSFSKNNRAEARQFFTQAASDPATSADALLSLSLLNWNENKLEAAFENFRKFYETSTNPHAYLYAVSSLPFLFESDKMMSKDKLEFFEKILADPNVNGTLKAIYTEQIGSHYQNSNNMKKAKEYFARMGAISHWQVLGTFDNTSGSGFSKDWGAVAKATANDVFTNKVYADVRWFTPPYNKPNNWFYFDYHFSLNNAVMYAQSFVTSPADQEVYLRAGTSGSLKMWVNDGLVSSVSEERNCDLDIYSYKVKLNKGVNRLLVQIGQSEIDNANFLLRITDANANPIAGLVDAATYAEYTKSASQTAAEPLPFFAEEELAAKIKAQPNNQLNYFMLAEVYLRNDKAYEATKVLKSLEKLAPQSTLLYFRLAEAYARAKNQTDFDKEQENIKRVDPNSFWALQQTYNEAIKSEKYTEAEDICKKVKELYGVSTTTEDWDINIASYQKRYQDVMDMGKALYKKYPTRYDLMNLNYQIEKSISKDSKSSMAIIEKYCSQIFNSKALDLLADAYFDQGNTNKGLAILKQKIDYLPYATGFIDSYMSKLFHTQKYAQALEASNWFMAMSPYMSSVYNSRGYIYKSMVDETSAKENFKKSIYYGPTNYDSRSQLRQLENQKDVFDLFPKTDLKQLIANAPKAKDYPEDNSIFLLNEYQQVIYPEGAKEYRYEMATKILNQSGIEDWKEYSIGYNDNNQKLIIDKAEVYKANGSVVKAETDNDNEVVFTNLELNDVLHLEYRIQDLSTGKLANHFFNNFKFKYAIPSMISRYSILVPNDKKFNYVMANGPLEPTITPLADMKLYKWESVNQPAVKDEPYCSTLADIAPTLYFSSLPDWEYVSNWYKDLTSNKFDSDYELKETVNTLLAGKEKLSKLEKAKIFYNYILENITYSSVSFLQGNYIPQKASRTITTRLGDCKDLSTLFVALCREVGIDANLVLISTRNNGNSTMLLPATDFNHCIAQLNLDGKKYYLELTDKMLPFGAALDVDLNSEILPIPYANEPWGDKIIRLEMPFRPKNKTVRYHNVTLVNNDMRIDRRTIQFSAFASSVRNRCRNLGAEEQLKDLSESVASDFTTPIKITDLKYINLDNLDDSVMIDYKIEIKNAVQDVAGMKILKLPWSEYVRSLDAVNAETRKTPFQLWSLVPDDNNSEEIVVTLPKGKKFVELPKNISYDCANASYKLTFVTKLTGEVVVKRTYTRKTEEVSTQEYEAFREFMSKASEADNKQYAIK